MVKVQVWSQAGYDDTIMKPIPARCLWQGEVDVLPRVGECVCPIESGSGHPVRAVYHNVLDNDVTVEIGPMGDDEALE